MIFFSCTEPEISTSAARKYTQLYSFIPVYKVFYRGVCSFNIHLSDWYNISFLKTIFFLIY